MADRLVYLEPGLPGLPEDLMLARDRGDVMFLTGAGVSTPAPSLLPDFQGLVVEIYNRLDTRLAHAMTAYVEAQRVNPTGQADWRDFVGPLDAAQQTELKRFALREYDVVLGMLEQRIAGGMRATATEVLNAAKAPNTLHASLNVLARRFGEPLLVTTNFDLLHEAAAGRRTHRSYGFSGLPRVSRSADFHGVFHIHGQLGGEIALTDQDFGDLYMRRRLAADFIYDAVRIFHLVIIGYSLNDAPFRYLLNAVAGDSFHFPDLKVRYAIVPQKGEDVTVAEDWRARFIEPVCYDPADGHAQLQTLLAAWAKSAPGVSGDRWARRKLKAISKTVVDEATDADKSVFGYVFRRASSSERGALTRYLAEIGASPDWLTMANTILREDWERR